MKQIGLALACVLLVVGCASAGDDRSPVRRGDDVSPSEEPAPPTPPQPPPPVVVCLSVPSEVEDAVLAGVAGWRSVTLEWRGWAIASDPGSAPCDLWVLEIGPYARICDDMAASGCTGELGGLLNEDGGPATVYLVKGHYEWGPTAVVLHELGHTLGLTHEDGTIMQAEWPASYRAAEWACPDERTVERLRGLGAAGGCELPVRVR